MFTTIAAVVLALATTAHGHGLMVDPAPTFNSGVNDVTAYCGTMNGNQVLPGGSYSTSPDANAASFNKQFKASSYKTLKDLVSAHPGGCGTCGNTNPNGTPRSIPSNGKAYWHHGQEGFTPSHTGPCEVWCDNNLAYHNDNCATNIPDGYMPLDTSKCNGASRMTVYWLALHTAEWQIYLNCIPLTKSGGGPPSP
ncbi:hypothetical protein LEN26_003102, partial [Aphanomyces euteiches]